MSETKETKASVETQELKDAYVLSDTLGRKLIDLLVNLPIKYYDLVNPILQEVAKSPRGSIEIKIDNSIKD